MYRFLYLIRRVASVTRVESRAATSTDSEQLFLACFHMDERPAAAEYYVLDTSTVLVQVQTN